MYQFEEKLKDIKLDLINFSDYKNINDYDEEYFELYALDDESEEEFYQRAINENIPLSQAEDELYDIWENYVKAMNKRRGGSALGLSRFVNYIINYTFCYKYKNTYIFGVMEKNNFVPTHFSNGGFKEGIDAIKGLLNYDNVIFAVTEDLAKMLKKLGYKAMPFKIKREFRGMEVEKMILSSNWIGSIIYYLIDALNKEWESFKTKTKDKIGQWKNKINLRKDKNSYYDSLVDEDELYR